MPCLVDLCLEAGPTGPPGWRRRAASQGGLVFQPGLQGGVEQAAAVAPGVLGLVHGRVGSPEQFMDAGVAAPEQTDADAGAAVVHLLLQRAGRAAAASSCCASASACERFSLGFAQLVHQHDELIAANACDRMGWLQPYGPGGAQFLPGTGRRPLCPQRVVDGLEVVQVQQQQCAVLVVLAAGIECSLDALAQAAAVGQAGQGSEVGKLVNGLFMGGKAGPHGPQLEQQGADLVAAVHGNGRVELPGGNLRGTSARPAARGEQWSGSAWHPEAQQGHGGQQRQCHWRVRRGFAHLPRRWRGPVGTADLSMPGCRGLRVRTGYCAVSARRWVSA